MVIRIDFKSGDWIRIENISGIEVVGGKLCVNLTLRSTRDGSYDIPEQEHANELRCDYHLEQVDRFLLSE